MGDRILFFFTNTYPYNGSDHFIWNEEAYISQNFKQTLVFPYQKKGKLDTLPQNIHVVDREVWPKSMSIFQILVFIPLILRILLIEFLSVKKKLFWLSHFKLWLKHILNAINNSEFIESKIKKSKSRNIVFYSFWMNEWTLALAILKYNNKISKFAFRCAGYDIYNERHQGNYLPFRTFTYSKCEFVYPNNQMGSKYIKNLNIYPEKIKTEYWGTRPAGIITGGSSSLLKVVSCSAIIPLKQVHLILEALVLSRFPFQWDHFGDGPDKIEIGKKITALGVGECVKLHGHVTSEQLFSYYKNNDVSVFINASKTEGLPVTIQEAMSFGIPVIAPNVGGVKEAVTEEVGILLTSNFDTNELMNAIQTLHERQEFQKIEKRKLIQDIWNSKFNAELNYTSFFRKLKSF